MNCREIEHKLIFYVEGNLTDDEMQKISEHLTNCKSCSEKFALLRKSFDLIEIEKNEKINPFISTQILQKVNAKTKKQKSAFIKILKPVFIAAFMILAVWIGNVVSNSYNSLENNNYQVRNSQTIDNTEQFAINDISYSDYYFINAQ